MRGLNLLIPCLLIAMIILFPSCPSPCDSIILTPQIQASYEADPCYWCFEDLHVQFAGCANCASQCPCPAFGPSMMHRNHGVVISDDTFMSRSTLGGSAMSCYPLKNNKLEVSIIFYISFDCDDLDCASNTPAPTTITSTIHENNIGMSGSNYQQTEIITSCDLKRDLCNITDNTCLKSFEVLLEFTASRSNTYFIVFDIDHDHGKVEVWHDQAKVNRIVSDSLDSPQLLNTGPHSHQDTFNISICPPGSTGTSVDLDEVRKQNLAK